MSDLAKRTFKKVTSGWARMDDAALFKAIRSGTWWARWPEQHAILAAMRKEAVKRFVDKYGTELDGHAIFAPSASHEWAYCSGSLHERLSKGDTAGIDAAMGTVAHAIAERWNKTGKEPRELLGTEMSAMAGGKRYAFTIDEKWLADAGRFVEWCNELPGDHYFETKVDISSLTPIPGQRGTVDHGCCSWGVLTITDLKNGMVRVYAENNPQCMLYAAGMFLKFDFLYNFEKIVIRICHPRLDVFDVWECSRQELIDFMDWIKLRAELALDPMASRTPGEKQCRYCGGKKTCVARALALENTIDAIMGADDDEEKVTFSTEETDVAAVRLELQGPNVSVLDDAHPRELSTTALEKLLLKRKTIEDFFKGVYEEVLRRGENGETLTHHFLGNGRATYKWTDEDAAVEEIVLYFGVPSNKVRPPAMLSHDAMKNMIRGETKMKPAAIEKVLQPLLSKFAGKRSLARKGEDRVDTQDDIGSRFDETDDYAL